MGTKYAFERKSLFAVVFAVCAVALSEVSMAQQVIVDTTFAAATPSTSQTPGTLGRPKLVIVRERYHGSAPVDLTGLVDGLGLETHVQSIYFRFFESNDQDRYATVGRVTFHPSIKIIGIETDGTRLGGELDDGTLTNLDDRFGLSQALANHYSELFRGFDVNGKEFVCQTSERSFVFGLNVQEGVDDFRVIIRYEQPVEHSLYFSVSHWNLQRFGGEIPDRGYIVGDPLGRFSSTVPGDGDWMVVDSLERIPLTNAPPPLSTPEPVDGCVLPFVRDQSLFVARYNSLASPAESHVDALDIVYRLPAPNVVSLGTVVPVGVTEGPAGLLYTLGANTQLHAVDIDSPTSIPLPPANPGPSGSAYVDLTDLAASDDLYLVRSFPNAAERIDCFDTVTHQYTYGVASISSITDATAITDCPADGNLYVLERGSNLVRLDPSGAVPFPQTPLAPIPVPSNHHNVDLCALGDDLYILQMGATAASVRVLRHDRSQQNAPAVLPTTFAMTNPAGITVGPDGNLHIVGIEGQYAVIDLAGTTMFEIDSDCNNFSGSIVGIAFPNAVPSSQTFCNQLPSAGGCTPFATTLGVPSMTSPAPFLIRCSGVDINKNGIAFFGSSINSHPTSRVCVSGGLVRTPLQNSGASGCGCAGSFSFDFNAWLQFNASPNWLVAGTPVYAQYWYRDPVQPNVKVLSSAVQFVLMP